MSIESLTWIKAGNKITVILPSGQPKTVTEGDGNYEPVLEAIKSRNWDVIPDLLDPKVAIFNFSDGIFEVVDGMVNVEGKPVPNGLSKKIIEFAKAGLPYKPLLNFWNKLKNNPSYNVVQSLFEFLERNEYPITEDGDIIAYKGVNANWTDCHTGTILNTIGTTNSMPRNEVDNSPDKTCSAGFHVGNFTFSWNYGSGGHMIMVSVNPEHVVSMPNAYDFSKMRVCEYSILKEVFKEEKGNLYKAPIDNTDDVCYGNGRCDNCECEPGENEESDSDDYSCECEDYDCQSYDSHHQDCKCKVDDTDCEYAFE